MMQPQTHLTVLCQVSRSILTYHKLQLVKEERKINGWSCMHSVLESNNENGEQRKQDNIVAIINQRLGVPMSTQDCAS